VQGSDRRKDPDLDLGLPQRGSLAGHDDVAEGRQFGPPAEGRPLDHRHRRDLEGVEPPEDAVEGGQHRPDPVPHVVLDRHPGREGPPLGGEDQGAEGGLAGGRLDVGVHRLHHGDGQDVQGRPGQRDARHVAVPLETDQGIAHATGGR
jgi:hypothetical protein